MSERDNSGVWLWIIILAVALVVESYNFQTQITHLQRRVGVIESER